MEYDFLCPWSNIDYDRWYVYYSTMVAITPDAIQGLKEPRWPPRSPHEALLSSPTGRQRVKQFYDRTSPSPSPLKKTSSRNHDLPKRLQEGRHALESSEEEDEETLQLQLAAIEAKLKLKKIRGKKNTDSTNCDNDSKRIFGGNNASGKENLLQAPSNASNIDRRVLPRSKSSIDVQIPVSPQRKHISPKEVKSPGRLLLGIDKGLKGRNVSLRRQPNQQAGNRSGEKRGEVPRSTTNQMDRRARIPPMIRPANEVTKDDDPFQVNLPSGSMSNIVGASRSPVVADRKSANRPMSFSEKIAETRQQDKALKEKTDKLRKQRSSGFGISQEDIDAFQSNSERDSKGGESKPKTEQRSSVSNFSRAEILEATRKTNGGTLHRSNTSAGMRCSRAAAATDRWSNPNGPPEPAKSLRGISSTAKQRPRSLSPAREAADSPLQVTALTPSDSLSEPFSSLHLSKRLLPHDVLTRTLSGKHLFLLPDLLSAVKAPDFVLPDIQEPDHVILAIIASKSSPLNHKGVPRATGADNTSMSEAADSEHNKNGKYMVFTLTDLKWTVDLFLFATGYTRFRKLTPGTVIALLNPDIMPPQQGKADTGRFSLKVSSSDDTVLEIGTSRNLGWCKSVKKDGKQCETWIDKRHTEFCEFHVDVVIERTKRGRMETQGMSAPFAPGGRKGGRTGYFGDKRRGNKSVKDDGFIKDGPQYDRSSGSRYFVGPPVPGQSAAQLLDAEGATDRYGGKEDRVRKRLADRERENEIARKLGEGGNGAGSEYLRLKHSSEVVTSAIESQAPEPIDAISLGLLGNKARNVQLSPIKKRKASGLDIDRPIKKTRFVTDAGIKEAGRESFGGGSAVRDEVDAEEDDGLEVI